MTFKESQNRKRFMILGCSMVLLFTLIRFSSAQYSSNSLYSIYGIGDLVSNASAKQAGMGRAGVALPSDGFVNSMNPASLNSFGERDVVLDVGFEAYYSKFIAGDQEVNAFDGNFNHFSLGFPVTNWWGASLGLKPFSQVGYDVSTSSVYQGSTDEIDTRFTGTGGISQIYFNNAFTVLNGLSLGFSLSYLTGTISQEEITELAPVGFYDVVTSNTYYLRNLYLGFGLMYNLTLGNNLFSLGLNYTPRQNLINTYTHEVIVEADSEVTLTEERESADRVELPGSIKAGLAFQFNNRLSLAADYGLQEWSGKSSLIMDVSMTNRETFNLGLEWCPDPDDIWNYFNRVQYRIGAYYEKSYILVGERQVTDYGLTIGLGFPLAREKSRINLSAELGRMGIPSSSLVNEYYAGFTLDFSLYDRWFQKRKFD